MENVRFPCSIKLNKTNTKKSHQKLIYLCHNDWITIASGWRKDNSSHKNWINLQSIESAFWENSHYINFYVFTKALSSVFISYFRWQNTQKKISNNCYCSNDVWMNRKYRKKEKDILFGSLTIFIDNLKDIGLKLEPPKILILKPIGVQICVVI